MNSFKWICLSLLIVKHSHERVSLNGAKFPKMRTCSFLLLSAFVCLSLSLSFSLKHTLSLCVFPYSLFNLFMFNFHLFCHPFFTISFLSSLWMSLCLYVCLSFSSFGCLIFPSRRQWERWDIFWIFKERLAANAKVK